jgi:hypothetical protein
VDRGAIQSLVLAVAQEARERGLAVVNIHASRVHRSASSHIVLRDRRGRDWLLRISDHKRPPETGYEEPHFDLVTPDGLVGAELAFGFVMRVAEGREPWHEPRRTRIRKGQRVRGQR